jgi:hypothetical protein
MRNNIALQMADAWEANLILECPTEGLERSQKKMIKTIKKKIKTARKIGRAYDKLISPDAEHPIMDFILTTILK